MKKLGILCFFYSLYLGTNSKTVENQKFVQLFSPLLKQPRMEVWNGSD